MSRFKIQEVRMKTAADPFGSPSPFPSRAEWFDAVRVSMLNLAVTSWFVTIPLWHVWKQGVRVPGPLGVWSGMAGPRVLSAENDPWEPFVEIAKLAVCGVVVDTWFYWTHRALHITKPVNLYALIHKVRASKGAASEGRLRGVHRGGCYGRVSPA